MKKISKIVGLGVAAAGLLALAGVAGAAPGAQAIPFPSAWNVWGPVVQSDGLFGAFVRANTTKRHARDRYFYNTTSNSGSYFRGMDITCTAGQDPPPWGGPFLDNPSGDITLFCQNGGSLLDGHVTITSIAP